MAMPAFAPPGPIGVRGLPGEFDARGGRTPGTAGDDGWDYFGAAFENISRPDLEATVKERVDDPSKINQRGSSLCGPASFLFCLASRFPQVYETFVKELYEEGEARIGGLEIRPGEDCRAYNPGGKIAAADWVGLASIRDSENAIFDYDEVDDALAGITLPGGLAGWFESCGLFDEVRNETNLVFTKGEDNWNEALQLFRNGWNVALFIRATVLEEAPFDRNPLLQPFTIPNHWVTLTSDVVPNRDKFSFGVFTWGHGLYRVPQRGDLEMDQWTQDYYGYVACR